MTVPAVEMIDFLRPAVVEAIGGNEDEGEGGDGW